MPRVLILSIISLHLLLSEILPQGNIKFEHLTVKEGLSQSSVTCILQDRKGFMWFGTQDGLNRYDGYTFKIFKNNPSDSTSLSDNFIFSIIEDQTGILYVETQSGNLHRYNPRLESFQIVNKDSVDLTSARINTVKAIFRESSGLVWTGGLGSETGLKRIDTNTGVTTVFKHDPKDPYSLSNDKVYSVFRDHVGNLWIGTFDGLDRFDEVTSKFYHYRHNPDDLNSIPDNWVWPIFEDSHGNLWIGTVNSGLCLFNPTTNKFTTYKKNSNDPNSINDNFIFSINEDRSGLIWIGTNLGGISYFNPATQAFKHYKHDPNNENSLSEDIVLSMLVDRKGDYWIGTRNNGLNKFDNKKETFTHYLHSPSNPNSLISNSIQSLLEDKSGIIWIGSYSSGLDAFHPKSDIFTHYTHDPSDSVTITDNRIYSLIEDRNGIIWIGTYGGGLNRLDKKTGEIYHYRHIEDDSTSISANSIWSLGIDDSDHLWIGTFGGGVNVFDRDGQTFQHFKNIPGDSTSIIDNNIIRVFKDSKGNMWFGTTKGLSTYSWESGNFKNYEEKDGLANSFVYGILEDNKGNLWISTNNGLSKFDPEKERFKNYYERDGLQGNEFNQSAFAKDYKTGNLLFGGLNGFNVFNPDSLKENTYPPPISFTAYTRFNTDDEEGKPIIEKGIATRDSIFLTYKDNIITFDFAALSFFNNFENQYRYKLEGFNDNWIQLGNNHSVAFTNLSPGEYNLQVIGSNNDGVWNETGTSLKIFVSPPWWKTKIAYIFYFLAVFGLLFGLRQFELKRREQKAQIRESALRIKATEAEKRALEIENERKTKELEEARQLQLSMLPKEVPSLDGLEIAAFMRTATEVGGDYYDFIVQENGVLNVAFGDATGHGLQAGTMVTLMKGFFTSDSSKLELNEFMNHCSKVIKEIKLGRILMSFTYLKIDNKKLRLTSAGMPPIFYHNKKTNEIEEISIQGIPLGAMRSAKYQILERQLNSGDTLLLLTDGLPEQMNNQEEMFDYMRLRDHFCKNIESPPEAIIQKLIEAGDHWMDGRIQDDDITFVVIRVK
jgi:ligand-binding sensor domain-containing protein/serine phosphatase RsbU (regulator of sigma subunit)